ncbi:ROK family protein [Catenovulum sediminis]|uniref:ROK family protein n=1 Tax=Catenovulum sediminis TaxID=1740262 RepID=UPI00163D85A0|nr:ROK family protein [Catenovulum sediminis]
MSEYYAAIEAGGTKFNCALMNSNREIIELTRIATTTPQETISQVLAFYRPLQALYKIKSLGLASFGPMDLNANSGNYGGIAKTPKPSWSYTPLSQKLNAELGLPVFFDTDVNGAILAEYLWGKAQNSKVAVYVTIGTGVGGGIIVNGHILNGLHHPEMGHMLLPTKEDNNGHCPFHGNCLEGLAAGPSIQKTWQEKAENLADDHPAWQQQVDHIAAFCHNLIVTLGPEKIILGGGVLQKPGLLEKIAPQCEEKLNQYLTLPQTLDEIIVAPGLGDKSGLYGALALAMGHGSHQINR